MEFKINHDKLQTLARKACDLHVRINEEINRCIARCADAECGLEKMISIRDSLKDVHTTLIFLQRLELGQSRKRDEAIVLLEESRRALINRINEFSEKKGKRRIRNEVLLEELIITFVKDGKTEFPRSVGNWFSRFVVSTIRFGLEFVVIFACIYAGVRLCDDSQKKKMKNVRLEEEVCAPVPILDSSTHLDVSCGRG